MTALRASQSANFGFLAPYDDALVAVAAQAERYFADDPVTCLMKLRQFGELLAGRVGAGAEHPMGRALGRRAGHPCEAGGAVAGLG